MKLNDLIQEQDNLIAYKREFYLYPKYWETLNRINIYKWETIQFDEKNRKKIPASPGIYTFVINPSMVSHPQRYLFYIGKEETSLRDRFNDYLRGARDKTERPAILRLLNKWYGYLEFTYTLLDKTDLKSIESQLINAFLPPCNKQVSSKIYKIIGAF